MRIGIIGSGRIGGNLGRLLGLAGHEVLFSFTRDPNKLTTLADSVAPRGRTGSAREAVEFGDAVVLSVPWSMIDEALRAAGPLAGKIVIDTTNPYGPNGLIELGVTSARYNQRRMPGAALVKAFNTLTAGFQAEAAGRTGEDRVVAFYVADDKNAATTAAELIDDAGFTATSLGGLDDSALLEAPRRPGAVYGEEYHAPQAAAVAALWTTRSAAHAPTATGSTFVQRYIQAFGAADFATLRTMYDENVVFYTPLSWGAQGRDQVLDFVAEFHRGYPGLTTTLHDEFYNADGTRACFRFVLHWHHTGEFFGHAPTGERGTMSETHSIRIANGRIVEQWVGDNSFQMPHQELVEFGMDFPRDTPDPVPPILTVTAPGTPEVLPSTGAAS